MQMMSLFVMMELNVLSYSLSYNKHAVEMAVTAGTISSKHPALGFYNEQSPP